MVSTPHTALQSTISYCELQGRDPDFLIHQLRVFVLKFSFCSEGWSFLSLSFSQPRCHCWISPYSSIERSHPSLTFSVTSPWSKLFVFCLFSEFICGAGGFTWRINPALTLPCYTFQLSSYFTHSFHPFQESPYFLLQPSIYRCLSWEAHYIVRLCLVLCRKDMKSFGSVSSITDVNVNHQQPEMLTSTFWILCKMTAPLWLSLLSKSWPAQTHQSSLFLLPWYIFWI